MRNATGGAIALAALAALPLCGAEYHMTGPLTHENLSVYLIHGPDRSTRRFLTLQEALEQKKVVVYETGNVNELAVENVSGEDVYAQSGDIVKGGQQDRTLKDDIILTSHSGRIPISAFCVEHGRWSRRGQETVTHFDSSSQTVATREMKQAVRAGDQAQVWSMVEGIQKKLKSTLAGSVAASASPSSLMLSLESTRVQKPVEEYIKALSNSAEASRDVVGFAFAVNGKLSSADIYASNELFRKLWPKLLRASAVEAIAEYGSGPRAAPPALSAVRASLTQAAASPASTNDLTPRTKIIVRQTAGDSVFETRDRAHGDALVHRSYLMK